MTWRCPRRPLHPTLEGKRRIRFAEILDYYQQTLHARVEGLCSRMLLCQLIERWGPELTLFAIDQAGCEDPGTLGAPEWPGILRRFVAQAKLARGRLSQERRELEKFET